MARKRLYCEACGKPIRKNQITHLVIRNNKVINVCDKCYKYVYFSKTKTEN